MFTHHAVVCFTRELSPRHLPEALRVAGVDVVHRTTDRLTIDDVRALKESAVGMPLEAPVRSVVVIARELQAEAQHALLKLLEEPPLATRFVFVLPPTVMLLPTLRSRVHTEVLADTSAELPQPFIDFLGQSYKDRLETVAQVTKDKQVEVIDALICGAEAYVAGKVVELPELAQTLRLIRRYVSLPGASRKMLLEALALALPAGRQL